MYFYTIIICYPVGPTVFAIWNEKTRGWGFEEGCDSLGLIPTIQTHTFRPFYPWAVTLGR